MKAANVLTISDLARAVGVAACTLRRYEKEGVLRPARDSTGRRLYEPADVQRVRRIVAERRALQGPGLRRTAEAAT